MRLENLFNTPKANNENKDNQFSTIEEVISMVDFGKREAITCGGELEMFNIYLQRIESGHIVKKNIKTEEELSKIENQQKQISKLEADIELEKEKLTEIEKNSIPRIKQKIQAKQDEFSELSSKNPRDEIITEEKFRPPVFYTLLFFVLALTVLLYYFYVNLGYVLFDLPAIMDPSIAFTCSPTVLNPLSQLVGDGGCNISAGLGSFLLPILFLSIAALIHMKMEKYFISKQKIKGILTIGFFVLLVLILDIVLAIKFESKLFYWNGSGGIYEDQFPSGLIEQLKYCIDQPAFILILGLGFMSYIIWSFLIHELAMEYEKKDPEIVWRRKLRAIEAEVERLDAMITSLTDEVTTNIPKKIRGFNKQINRIREQIKLTKIGGKDELKKALLEFTTGWNQFVIFKYSPNELIVKQSELQKSLKDFLMNSSTFRGIIDENEIKIA